MTVATRPTAYTVTEGGTDLYIKSRGEYWHVEWSAMNGAAFSSLGEATTAAERWVSRLEQARALREEATRVEREVVEEMGKTVSQPTSTEP